ncbi:MAG TPA: PAAR domain-containing protein [Chitinophagaceae bacterium]
MPSAARITDMHVCPMVSGVIPHVGGPVIPPGCPTVLINGLAAASMGSLLICAGAVDSIIAGSSTVFITGKPAARMGDSTAHGGTIVLGSLNVIIGG